MSCATWHALLMTHREYMNRRIDANIATAARIGSQPALRAIRAAEDWRTRGNLDAALAAVMPMRYCTPRIAKAR